MGRAGTAKKAKGTKTLDVTVITCNAAGAKYGVGERLFRLGRVFAAHHPDFICLQEITWIPPYETMNILGCALAEALEGVHYTDVTEPAICMAEDDPHTRWREPPWRGRDGCKQGLGLMVHPDWDLEQTHVVPVYESGYGGNRDTEPRHLIRVHARHRQSGFRIFVGGTHLTTLKDEHDDPETGAPANREAKANAPKLRHDQVGTILSAFGDGKPAILMGDFNATLESHEIRELQKKGCFTSLRGFAESTQRDRETPTHIKHKLIIDHIFLRPAGKVPPQDCEGHQARYEVLHGLSDLTDHRPVVGKLTFEF